MRRFFRLGLAISIAAGLIIGVAASPDQLIDISPDLVREASIGYFTTPAADPVAALKADLARGAAHLAFDETTGYLPSVAAALHLPVDSQVLVFSKTSVQSRYINPGNPRAILFNDAVAVGYIHGAEYLEFAAQDPRQGVVFYTLDQRRSETPAIERRDFCLTCHNGNATVDVPGMLVRSLATMASGSTAPRFANYVSDHRSPFDERWGGYYVTGQHGSMTHLGNRQLIDRNNPDALVTDDTRNVASLEGRFALDHYLSPHGDIVALLVFEHQMRMMNLITRLGWEARVLAAQDRDSAAPASATVNELVDYLLFVDEIPLPAPVRGTSRFADTFQAQGPTDRRGRSLRHLDLSTRLLRYPCSYLIYSDAFNALPPLARRAVYTRMWQVLSGADHAKRYARRAPADRRAIVEILLDTKKDLPDDFRPISQ
jgi:hypothetical protein